MDINMLICDEPCVLNIGLGAATNGPWRLSVAHRLRVFSKVLPIVLEGGHSARLQLVPQRVWVGEPLLVVHGTFQNNVSIVADLYAGIEEGEQDCIAIYYPEMSYGTLFGPKSKDWGEFDLGYFQF